MGCADQRAQVSFAAEVGTQAEEVGDRITEVTLGRGGGGRQPEGIDAERRELAEPRCYVRQASRHEEERRHRIDYGTLDPSRALVPQVDYRHGRPQP